MSDFKRAALMIAEAVLLVVDKLLEEQNPPTEDGRLYTRGEYRKMSDTMDYIDRQEPAPVADEEPVPSPPFNQDFFNRLEVFRATHADLPLNMRLAQAREIMAFANGQ